MLRFEERNPVGTYSEVTDCGINAIDLTNLGSGLLRSISQGICELHEEQQ